MRNLYDVIQTGIGEIGRRTFEGKAISVSLLKLYCEDIRSFLSDKIAEYIENLYRENLAKIPSSKKGDFLNLEHGYFVSMTNWVTNNPIQFPEIDFMEESASEKISHAQEKSLCEIANKESVRILGIGSFVNIILWISGLKIVSLVAETAVVGVGVYKMINETKQPLADNNSQRRTFELKANSFIANVNNIANEYVHYVETKSNELLNSYLNF